MLRSGMVSAGRFALVMLLVAGCGDTPPPPGGQRDLGRDNGWLDPDTCERISVQATRESPSVLILLDRSGSMYAPPLDRWTPAVAAVNQVVASHSDTVAFGLGLFAADYACGTGTVRVAPGVDTASSIADQLSGDPAVVTGGGTPTASMLNRARMYFTTRQAETPAYVVLVTDGAPNCNPLQSGRTTCLCTFTDCENTPTPWLGCLDDQNTIAAVAALAAAGIPTWVIGYDTPELSDVLDAMAVAGDTGRSTYIPVEDQATLASALDGIAADLVSCTFTLSRAPEDVSYVRVLLDGDPVPHTSQVLDGGVDPGATGTFVLEAGTLVRLEGAACERLQDGRPHDLTITRECEPVIFE